MTLNQRASFFNVIYQECVHRNDINTVDLHDDQCVNYAVFLIWDLAEN